MINTDTEGTTESVRINGESGIERLMLLIEKKTPKKYKRA